MRLLIDTHILFWALAVPERLTEAERKALEHAESTIFVSAASLWEMRIKAAKGKLTLPDNFLDYVRSANFIELPVTLRHADAIRNLPPIHGDPFDRILAAQAKVENLALMTRDRFLREYRVSLFEG
ncbi:MAG: type II toxin-antitoxin system VapC family toxin [Verrucomicrobiota bacterium JB022]|nr:type II toxin-antitoxin system VapC family toxin [Verrucomicrobiota bacterium JB022]